MPGEKLLPWTLALLAVLLYAPGLDWGVPAATQPELVHTWADDELAPMHPLTETRSYLTHSNLGNPQYPLFHHVVLAVAYVPYLGVEYVRGRFRYAGAGYPYGFRDPAISVPALVLIARSVSLLMGAGVVVIGFLIAKRLWGLRAGVAAGLITLVSYPMVYYAKISNVDVPALFWGSLFLLQAVAIFQEGLTTRRGVVAGVFAALAVATKDYQYALVLALGIPLGVQQIVAARRLEAAEARQRRKALVAAVAASAAVYLPASGLALWPAKFLFHVQFLRTGDALHLFYYRYAASAAGYGALLWESIRFTGISLTWPLLFLAGATVLYDAFYERKDLWLLAPIPATFLLAFAPVRFVAPRFVMVWVFLLGLFAARGLILAWNSRRSLLRVAAAVLAIGGMATAVVRGVDLNRTMSRDSRYDASRWLAVHVMPGSTVGYFGGPNRIYGLAALPEGATAVPLARPLAIEVPRIETDYVLLVGAGDLSDHTFCSAAASAALQNGSLGYALAARFQSPTLFREHSDFFNVNPEVLIFGRERPSLRSGTAR